MSKVKTNEVYNESNRYGKIKEYYDINPDKWSSEYATKIWEAVGDEYINSRFRCNRTAEMSWKTLYNKILKENVFYINDNG